jgi:EEF1A lysine methyltransferase 2
MSKLHWDEVYDMKKSEELGWFQEIPQPDLDLINELNLPKNARIAIAGVGSSTLIDYLSDLGYENLILIDISEKAIQQISNRLQHKDYEIIIDDLTEPDKLLNLKPVDLWIDRAVLHFFIETEKRKNYRELIKSKIKPMSYVLLAEFSTKGVSKCSGLDVRRYDENLYKEFLGNKFILQKSLEYTYKQPSGGLRPFIYAIFKSGNTDNQY